MASTFLKIPAVAPPKLSYLSSFIGAKISRVKCLLKPCMAIQNPLHSTGHQACAAVQPYSTKADSDPYIPVYVMMPLGIISLDGHVLDPNLLLNQLEILKSTGADGVMIDVWWGIVEASPKLYNWTAYRVVFEIVRGLNLKLQVVMSFHECGGNVGDDVHIPIPKWVTHIGKENKDIFFTDREGRRNQECLSWGIDEEHVLEGRTALEVYFDFMKSFRLEFDDLFEGGVISEVEIGLGPCGELRFPSYPEKFGWKYPGIGEFQCYDAYLSKSLEKAAKALGIKSWGVGPGDAGSYNSKPQETNFFCHNNGGYESLYGGFFLRWYSQVLIDHGDKVLGLANLAFKGTPIAAKVSGIHWWYKTNSHAAELTAGFYNVLGHCSYSGIMSMLKKHEAALNFTCLELRTVDQEKETPGALADPEGLVWLVLKSAWNAHIAVAGENALPCYHIEGYNKILEIAKPSGGLLGRNPLSCFTYLRLCPTLLEESNLREFERFVGKMHGVQV